MSQPGGENLALVLFHYIPNKPLAITGIVIFGLFAVFLAGRIFWTRSSWFLYVLVITALMELTGYLFRNLCSEYTDVGRFIAMTLLLLLSPNALALVNYKAVGEIIQLSNVQKSPFYLRPRFVTWFFFFSDIAAFFLQGAGGGLQSDPETSPIGIKITLVGLSVQLFFFTCFGFITVYVHLSPKYNYEIEGQPNAKRNLINCLFITLALLYVRSIYRLAKYATGYEGPIATREWIFYVFDGLAITLCFVTYSIQFIGDYLPRHGSNAVSGDDFTEHSLTSVDNLNQVEYGMETNTKSNNNKYNVKV